MRTDLSAMTFGIEIETTIPAASMAAQQWSVGAYHVGADIPEHPGWKTMHDGSIRARYPAVGVEVVSPVLRGVEGLESVRTMLAKLKLMGARVNRSTGFHVHVGWNGTPEQLRRLICFVAFHEKALYASTGTTSREHNSYCSSIKATYRPLANLQSEQDIIRHAHSRYHVLNLQPVLRAAEKRTVEFRVFAGTLNVTKIEAYIALCLAFVQKALDSTRNPLPFDAPVSERKARLGTGDGVWAMQTLMQHLVWRTKTPPNGRQALGILDRSRIGAYKDTLIDLARQYDARVAVGR